MLVEVTRDICDLYEGNHKVVIFRKGEVDEHKRNLCHISGWEGHVLYESYF